MIHLFSSAPIREVRDVVEGSNKDAISQESSSAASRYRSGADSRDAEERIRSLFRPCRLSYISTRMAAAAGSSYIARKVRSARYGRWTTPLTINGHCTSAHVFGLEIRIAHAYLCSAMTIR
jgi:hypothetical protein